MIVSRRAMLEENDVFAGADHRSLRDISVCSCSAAFPSVAGFGEREFFGVVCCVERSVSLSRVLSHSLTSLSCSLYLFLSPCEYDAPAWGG